MAEGKALAALLDELGVGPAGAGAVVSAAPARPATAVPPVSAEPPVSVWTGWWWGPAGLLLGAFGLLALQRRRRAVSPSAAAEDDAPELWEAQLDQAGAGDHRVTARGV